MKEHAFPVGALHQWVTDLFTAAGSCPREATCAADHLVAANLTGHDSHGVGMVPRYVKAWANGELHLNRNIDLVVDTGPMVVADAGMGLGQYTAWQAMQVGIERARRHGIALLGLRHSHHIGRVGHWAEMAVDAGLVSIHFTNALNSNPPVAPYGGAQARYVTNPFTVGIPRRDDPPVVLDFATSATAAGKVRVAMNKGVALPEGQVLDHEGQPSTDPGVIFREPKGAIRTFAGHKGHALAMVVELLGAAMIGGKTTHPGNYPVEFAVQNNMLAILFDPSQLGTGAAFEAETRDFVAWVQSARLDAVGEQLGGVLLPGDPERRSRMARAETIPIDENTMQELRAAGQIVTEKRKQSLADPFTLVI